MISGQRQVATTNFIQLLQVYQIPSTICHTPPHHTLTPSQPLLAPALRCCVWPKIIISTAAAVTFIIRGQGLESPLNSSWQQQSYSCLCWIQLIMTNTAVTGGTYEFQYYRGHSHSPCKVWRTLSTLGIKSDLLSFITTLTLTFRRPLLLFLLWV